MFDNDDNRVYCLQVSWYSGKLVSRGRGYMKSELRVHMVRAKMTDAEWLRLRKRVLDVGQTMEEHVSELLRASLRAKLTTKEAGV
jgi:hypothetical protein